MKKRLLFAAVAACLLVMTVGPALAQTLSYVLDAPPYQISKDSDGFDKIEMTGFSTQALPGNPVLPYQTINLLVHPDAIRPTIKLTVVAEDFEVLAGTYSIRPAGPDTARIDGQYVYDWGEAVHIENGKNMDVYGQDAFFPTESVRAEPYSQLRQWKFIRVVFRPFQYNPVTGELRRANRVQFNITYSRSSDQAGAVMSSDLSGATGPAPSIFYNYGEMKPAYTSSMAADIPGAATYDYVIITTNAIVAGSSKLAAFIAHKQGKGHSVLVVTEDDFGALVGQAPNHRAEKIRKWLIDNYAGYGIQYVLLIGDPSPFESGEGDIPMKMCWPRNGEGTDEESPTDMFYAELTGNWDLDGDQFYGEYGDDTGPGGIDYSAEVYVGRIPVYAADYASLDSILQKMIDYETEVNPAWRNSILLPMSFSMDLYDGAPLAEQMKDDFLVARGLSTWTQYQQGNGACGPDSIYASDEELRGGTVVRDRWAGSPFGIVCWWGHGSQTGAAVGYDLCWDGTLFDTTQTSALDDSKPAFTFQISCTNGYPENNGNLGYSLLKKGAVSTIAASRVSWFNTGVVYGGFDGSSTNSGMGYEYVSRLTQQIEAGKALSQVWLAVLPLTSNTRLMNFFDFNLYGDPAMNTSGISNTPPVANNQNVTTDMDTPKAITLTASDVESDPLTFSIVTSPQHGSLAGSAPNVTYTPDAGYAGADSFTFKANDGYSDSNTATVSITVEGVQLTVQKNGAGTGTITSAPAGINCGVDCSEYFNAGTVVTLSASPDAGSALKSWSLAECPGNGDCVVTMDAAKTVTATFEPDQDNDGISSIVENGGPNGGDGNQDGTLDSLQTLVSTFQDMNGDYVTLVGAGGVSFQQMQADGNPSPGDAPSDNTFPCGFFTFRLSGVTPGGTASVTVIIHHSADINKYYKYGPEPGNPTPHWYKFMYDQSTGAEIFQDATQTRIVLHFVDGGRGDDDLTANGVIDDTGGPSLGPADATSSGGGGGGGGGCFIESLFR